MIKVVTREDHKNGAKVYFLNLIEPKPQQLFLAIFDGLSINTLTVYNQRSNQFEDVTALFQTSFLNDLSLQLSHQLISHNQAQAF